MRIRICVLVLLLAVACRIERIVPGHAGASVAESRARTEDSAIVAALTTYYDRFSRRSWREFRQSFWPGAVLTTRWQAPGDREPRVHVQTLDQFLRQTKDGPDRLAVFEERLVHHEIRRYGDLATVWATFRATFGSPGRPPETHYGVDAFQLLFDRGEWRIVSLAFTQELPGDSLPRDF